MGVKVAIIHPWIPQYRVAFFEKLTAALAAKGITLDLFYGEPELDWKLRGDQIQGIVGRLLPTKQYRLFGRSFLNKNLSQLKIREYELVIVEQAIRNLETYVLLMKKVPTAFWGHGKTYTQQSVNVLETAKKWITKKGTWFFAYTEGGKQHVLDGGFAHDRVTVLNNTFDTSELKANLDKVSQSEVNSFLNENMLTQGKVGLFIGALDKSKRIDLLLDAAEIVHRRDEEFRLLVVGGGPEEHRLQELCKGRTWVHFFKPKFGKDKAVLLRACDLLLVPGRVGLIAIDSFTAGKPIVTTPDPFHPPEFEYLVNGYNSVVSESVSSVSYANAIIDSLKRPMLDFLSKNAHFSAEKYSIEAMVSAFTLGIMDALTAQRDEH